MASPNKNPDYQAKLPRYGHDLSFDFGFTCSTGMLLPVVYDLLNPGEKVSLSAKIFTQLQTPMAVPAQIDMEQVVDYFFVPMPMLFQPFESMIYQTNDYLSSSVAYMQSLQAYGSPAGRYQVEDLPVLPLYDSSGSVPVVSQLVDALRGFSGDYYYWALGSQVVQAPTEFEVVRRQAYRLLDMCGFNPDAICPLNNDGTGLYHNPLTDFNPNVFPYQLLAYQCVYQYFYRLDQWERFSNRSFNLDRYFGVALSAYAPFDLAEVLKLHYRPKYLDYFTNVKPSPYLQGVNLLANSVNADNSANILVSFEHWLSNAGVRSASVQDSQNYNLNQVTQVINTGSTNNGSQMLRNLRAADKFLQITARAANRYDDQVLAHLGYKVPHDVKHNIQYLGTQRAPFKIQQVVSTEGSTLGDRAGQAYGSVNSKGVSYTAPCHGVIIGIYSTMVKPRYIAGFDRANVIRNIHDFWNPEFDNLGMQPVFAYELQRMRIEPTYASQIAGWQWRYEEKKRKYSRVSSAFRKYVGYESKQNPDGTFYIDTIQGATNNPLSAYFNIQRPLYTPFAWNNQMIQDQTLSNDYLTSVTQAAPVTNKFPSSFDWSSMLVPPSQLNNVLAVSYVDYWTDLMSENPALMYQTDPFIVDIHFDFKKVSPMSVHAMPNIND